MLTNHVKLVGLKTRDGVIYGLADEGVLLRICTLRPGAVVKTFLCSFHSQIDQIRVNDEGF